MIKTQMPPMEGLIVALTVYLGIMTSPVTAQTSHHAVERPASRPIAPRPTMPVTFDREAVERLIADVEAPRNASILKTGYFLRRGRPALPVEAGFALLRAAVENEPVGTRRWFLLQSVRGFAAYRTRGISPDEGFEAYNALFTHASDAKADTQYVLRQAIAEFVGAVSGRFRDLNLTSDARTSQTLLNAWNAYLVALQVALPKGSATPEPEWGPAIKASNSQETFVPIVEKMLAQTKWPNSYELLVAAAQVLTSGDPARAVELLQHAKELLPRHNGKIDVNEAGRFYDTLVELLQSQKKLDEAIATQQERGSLLGEGQGKLLLLYWQKGDSTQVARLVDLLGTPTVSEREIQNAAFGLFMLAHNKDKADAKADLTGATLLQNYLGSARQRTREDELEARIALAHYFLAKNDKVAAKDMITLPLQEDAQPTTPRVRGLILTIKRMNEQMSLP